MPQRTSRQPWAEHKSTALGRFCCKTIFGAGTKNGFLPPRAFYEKVDDIQRWRDMQHTCTVGHRRSKRPSMRVTRRPPNAIRWRLRRRRGGHCMTDTQAWPSALQTCAWNSERASFEEEFTRSVVMRPTRIALSWRRFGQGGQLHVYGAVSGRGIYRPRAPP